MSTQDELTKAFDQLFLASAKRTLIPARLGILIGPSTYKIDHPDRLGYYFVSLGSDGGNGEVIARDAIGIDPSIPNQRLAVRREGGELVIREAQYVLGSGGGSPTTLDGLIDVSTAGVSGGDFLAYDGSTSSWYPYTPDLGGVIGLHALDDPTYHTGELDPDQFPEALLRDGTRSLTGNLTVAPGITIDGHSISGHVADPNAHHDAATAGNVGITVSGQAISLNLASDGGLEIFGAARVKLPSNSGLLRSSAGIQIDPDIAGDGLDYASGELSVDLGTGLEFAAEAVRVDEGYAFAWTGAHSWTTGVATFNSIATFNNNINFSGVSRTITAANTLVVSPTGNLTLSPTTDLFLDPTGLILLPNAQELKTATYNDFVAGIKGLQHKDSGGNVRQLTIGKIKADELHVRVFSADEQRVSRAAEFWSRSFGIVETDFTVPADEGNLYVWFEEAPDLGSFKLFLPDNWILFRTIDQSTGLITQAVWFQVMDSGVDDYAAREDATGPAVEPPHVSRQQWRIKRKSGGVTGTVIKKGSVGVEFGKPRTEMGGASGQGVVHLSALQEDGGPFIQIQVFDSVLDDVPQFLNKVRMGNLRDLLDYDEDTFGFAGGNDLSIAPSLGGFTGFALDDDLGLRLWNTDIYIYDGTEIAVSLTRAHGLRLLQDEGAFSEETRFIGWYNDSDVFRSGISSYDLDGHHWLNMTLESGASYGELTLSSESSVGNSSLTLVSGTNVLGAHRLARMDSGFIILGATKTAVGLGVTDPDTLESTFHVVYNNSETGVNAGVTIEQLGTGDSVQHFTLPGVVTYSLGIDNSLTGDPFYISASADLATTPAIRITTDSVVSIVGDALRVGITTDTTPPSKFYVNKNVLAGSSNERGATIILAGGVTSTAREYTGLYIETNPSGTGLATVDETGLHIKTRGSQSSGQPLNLLLESTNGDVAMQYKQLTSTITYTMGIDVDDDRWKLVVGSSLDGGFECISINPATGNVTIYGLTIESEEGSVHPEATGDDGIIVVAPQKISVDASVVRTSRTITTGSSSGLSGGGTLGGDLSLTINLMDADPGLQLTSTGIGVDATVVRTTRSITTASASGLQGGGTLDANRSLSINLADTNPGLELQATGISVDSSVVRTTRLVSTGSGLSGGGALSGDLTLSIDLADTNSGLVVTGTGLAIDLATNPGLAFVATGLTIDIADTDPGLQLTPTGIQVDSTVVRTSRIVGTASSSGLSGGGNLGSDLALVVNLADTNPGLTLTGTGVAVLLKTTNSALSLVGGLQVTPGDGITVVGNDVAVDSTVVRITRLVSTGAGLQGGGALATDLTLSVKLATVSGLNTTSGAALAVTPGTGIILASNQVRVDQAFSPTWTGTHTFNLDPQINANLDFLGAGRSITTNSTNSLTLAPGGNLILAAVGDLAKTSAIQDIPTGIRGLRFWDRGSNYVQLTVSAIKADELLVRVFAADETRLSRGEEYWSRSFGIVEEDSPALPADEGTFDVWFEDAPALEDAPLFDAGNYIMIRVVDRTSGLVLSAIWFEVIDGDAAGTNDWVQRQAATDGPPAHVSRQQWRLKRKFGGVTGQIIKRGNVALDVGVAGQGWVHLSALQDTGGPFIQVGLFDHLDSNAVPVHINNARFGNLNGVGGVSGNVWGIAAAEDISVDVDTGDYRGFIVDNVNGARFYNGEIIMYDDTTKIVSLAPETGLRMKLPDYSVASIARRVLWMEDVDAFVDYTDIPVGVSLKGIKYPASRVSFEVDVAGPATEYGNIRFVAMESGNVSTASYLSIIGGNTDRYIVFGVDNGGAHGEGSFRFVENNASTDSGVDISQNSTGDAALRFFLSTPLGVIGQTYTIGIDNSDSDRFKISGSNSLGTTDILTITTTQAIFAREVKALDFLAQSTSGDALYSVSNVAGSASWYMGMTSSGTSLILSPTGLGTPFVIFDPAVGTDYKRSGGNNLTRTIADGGAAAFQSVSYVDAVNGGSYTFSTARGSEGTPTVSQSGDRVGVFLFNGYSASGVAFRQAAAIGVFIDGTPDNDSTDMPGRIALYTTPDGESSSLERMRINNKGNFGFGTTDIKAWDSGWTALQISAAGAIMAHTTVENTWVMSNAYYDGTWKRRLAASTQASAYSMSDGQHNWWVTGLGTADSSISWDNPLTILNTGLVGVNNASPAARLDVVESNPKTEDGIKLTAHADPPTFVGYRANGSPSSPSGIGANETMLLIGARARHSSGAPSYGSYSAYMQFVATEAHSSTARGSRIEFYTTSNATNSQNLGLTLDWNALLYSLSTYSATVAVVPNMAIANDGKITRTTHANSSLRYKDNVEEIRGTPYSKMLEGLVPVSYTLKDDVEAKRRVGFIAEQLNDLPGGEDFIQYDEEGRPDAIYYDRLVVALLMELMVLKRRVHGKQS